MVIKDSNHGRRLRCFLIMNNSFIQIFTILGTDEDYLIISEPHDNYLTLCIGAFLLLTAYIFLLQQSIIQVSWMTLILSVVFLLLGGYLIMILRKSIYYFYPEKIIIAAANNNYIDQIEVKDIIDWNINYTKNKNRVADADLIVRTNDKVLTITKSNYKNFPDFLEYFKNLNLPPDEKLTSTFRMSQEEIFNPWEKKVNTALILCIILTILTFWLIVRKKSDSDEKIYFLSQITIINFNKHDAVLGLKDYPFLRFRTKNKAFFKDYYYNSGNPKYVYQDKTIKLSVLKSDYDWLIKNELIRKIRWSSNTDFRIESFQILD